MCLIELLQYVQTKETREKKATAFLIEFSFLI